MYNKKTKYRIGKFTKAGKIYYSAEVKEKGWLRGWESLRVIRVKDGQEWRIGEEHVTTTPFFRTLCDNPCEAIKAIRLYKEGRIYDPETTSKLIAYTPTE